MKQALKSKFANLVETLVGVSVNRGCITQDDVIYKLSKYEKLSTPRGEITFFCPGEIPIWRAKTFHTKEPETIEWIDSFKENETFLDVGANIGLYSIYAAHKGHKVCAIEPLNENYFILQRNIMINELKNITAYCLCLYNENKLDTLKIRNVGFGQAENSFDVNKGAFNEKYEYKCQQGVVGITLDYLTEQTFVPDHIKIDVDGHELKVLEGGKNTLKNNKVKTILIEMNEALEECKELIEFICQFGFSIHEKSSSDLMSHGKYGMFKNYIFRRDNL